MDRDFAPESAGAGAGVGVAAAAPGTWGAGFCTRAGAPLALRALGLETGGVLGGVSAG